MEKHFSLIITLVILCIFTSPGSCQNKPPNIVLILTDDQDVTMDAMTPMEKTLKLIGDNGVTFSNMFTSSPLCCPSRSSILTGKYVHNHGSVNNSLEGNCSSKSWQQGPEKSTFATYLKSQGYVTFMAGKYLNRYGEPAAGGVEHIPPGWDWWIGLVKNSVYYNYTLSVNGTAEAHHDDYEKDYLTDVIKNRSLEFLDKRDSSKPFFLMASTPACHSPFDSAPQYEEEFKDKNAPRGPSFNKHGGDKHWLIRRAKNPMSNVSLQYVDSTFKKRWRTLLSVDDMVEAIVNSLTEKKLIDNTFIIYTSDNGFHLGQFSLPNDKRQLYEFDVRIPLLIRGPGVPKKKVITNSVMNIDIMPTIVHLSGLTPPSDIDGASLLPLLFPKNDTVKSTGWREEFLVEHQGEWLLKGTPGCKNVDYLCNCYPDCVCEDSINNTYSCIWSLQPKQKTVYCEFLDDENFIEFYDLVKDPHQLANTAKTVSQKILSEQNQKLIALSICKGPSCRKIHPIG
ncbi:N-acetylglucosamine-6-sulfatase-like isoform X2 [Anneissia japonica]|uniref:N-acetylglucosamine-6-sulfatase-like isoform X2 n=1 Tax=Anneissia japonica TaxID=1529436 RepID=UPI0014255875|nr:N-acetylglucosamine-6-sulfatase-like isoform X2 [Anneissia japonica]